MPVAIWATVLLFGHDARAIFQAESQQRDLSQKSKEERESAPRFSRKAILGTCWAPFVLGLFWFITRTFG